MTSDALTLAALATAAVPGLRAIRAEAVCGRAGERFQVGFVEDAEHRRWVVRVPSDAVAAAQQDGAVALLGMLARRLPFAVPAPKGFAGLRDGRRAMVYPLINGHAISFYALPPGPGLAAELGRALAALHNVDRRLFEEAGMPSYDAEESRHRHLVEVDRGAQTGQVPVGLLSRWERMLDDVSLWRFAPAPVHGRLDGPHVLASFSSDSDAASGRVRAVVGWEEARVGDPAEDFAALVASASKEAVDTVVEAYTMSRLEHPDPHLESRARLIAELRLVSDLLAATSAKDRQAVAAATHALRRLDAEVGDPDMPAAPDRPDSAADIVPASKRDDGHLYSAGTPEQTSTWHFGEAPPEEGSVYAHAVDARARDRRSADDPAGPGLTPPDGPDWASVAASGSAQASAGVSASVSASAGVSAEAAPPSPAVDTPAPSGDARPEEPADASSPAAAAPGAGARRPITPPIFVGRSVRPGHDENRDSDSPGEGEAARPASSPAYGEETPVDDAATDPTPHPATRPAPVVDDDAPTSGSTSRPGAGA